MSEPLPQEVLEEIEAVKEMMDPKGIRAAKVPPGYFSIVQYAERTGWSEDFCRKKLREMSRNDELDMIKVRGRNYYRRPEKPHK